MPRTKYYLDYINEMAAFEQYNFVRFEEVGNNID